MVASRPFAYNPIPPNSPIFGTTQVGDLAIGNLNEPYTDNYGGVTWWNGPEEASGYVIAVPVSGNTQPTPIFGVYASVGFYRSKQHTDPSFLEISDYLGNKQGQPPFTSTQEAYDWLTAQGYWTSFVPPNITLTPTPTVTQTPTPTVTQTPTATDSTSITTYTISGCTSLNQFVANLGPGALAPGDVFYFDFTGGTPSGCYRIVNKINATPTDGTTPLYFYSSCALCVAAREVTPTPTVTQTPTTTPTPSVTNTQTPTLTPTPSSTQTPVTGYSFNLVVLPYNYPSSGNSILNASSGQTGTTLINQLSITGRGYYFSSIDNISVDRTSYYSQFTGQSVTITFTQNGDSAIYSGDTTSFKYWSGNTGDPGSPIPGAGFVFGTQIQVPPLTGATGTAILIQSASTTWVTGATVYVSVVNNNPSVTPTPTATSVTPTPTPTSGYTSDGWLFYSPDNSPVLTAPLNNGNTTFIYGGTGVYSPNYTGGTLGLYFNNNNSAGTSYSSQFSTLDTAGGTITISQGSSTAIYSGTSTDYQSSGTFIFLNVTRAAQMIQSASTRFVSGSTINVVVS